MVVKVRSAFRPARPDREAEAERGKYDDGVFRASCLSLTSLAGYEFKLSRSGRASSGGGGHMTQSLSHYPDVYQTAPSPGGDRDRRRPLRPAGQLT